MNVFILDGLDDPAPPAIPAVRLIPNVAAARGLALGTLLGALVWAVLAAATYLALVF
jgi:hypothetical protein